MTGPPGATFGASATGPHVLRLCVPARPEHLFPLRRALRHWLSHTDADEEEVIAVQIAAGEATANAVEHAYQAQEPGPVVLTAELEDDDVVRVEVADQGHWRPPRADPDGRGRGLLLMRECVDDLDIACSSQGTTVVLRLTLRAKQPPSAPAPTPTPIPTQPPTS